MNAGKTGQRIIRRSQLDKAVHPANAFGQFFKLVLTDVQVTQPSQAIER